jgi:hypothetical protein
MPANDQPPAKPKGWEKLSREGSSAGAESAWDEESKRHYHVLANGDILFHDRPKGSHVVQDAAGGPVVVPAGFRFDKDRQQMFDSVPEAPAVAAPAAQKDGS